MIKFFRKIRYNLMDQNKTGKYLKYAIGEIILVMIGILLALQVNTWNEQRKDKLKEKAILTSIHEEFTKNRVQLDSVLKHNKLALEGCTKLVNRFPIDITKENLDSLGSDLSDALDGWTFNPSQGSINGLINTSSFDLITNDELRNILVSWPDLLTDLQEDEAMAKNPVNDFLDPYLSDHIDYDMYLKDPRVNLEVFESLKFEYLIKLRLGYLEILFKDGQELETVQNNLNRILELTAPNKND